jgi:hypothetical protein
MLCLIVHHTDGTITNASMREVFNLDTWRTDGYITRIDGRNETASPSNTHIEQAVHPKASSVMRSPELYQVVSDARGTQVRKRTDTAPSQTMKRGLALACGGWNDARAATNATWVMNWNHSESSHKTYGEYFVPTARRWDEYDMRIGRKPNADDALSAYANRAATYPGRYWLLGNEPNNSDPSAGDGYDAKTAAYVYSTIGRVIQKADPTARLIAGGLFNFDNESEMTFMATMLAIWPTDVKLSGLHWHIYQFNENQANVARAKAIADRFVAYTKGKSAKWETWITEWGCIWDSLTVRQAATYISETADMLDKTVDKHAYFTWSDGCMGTSWRGKALEDDPSLSVAFKGA